MEPVGTTRRTWGVLLGAAILLAGCGSGGGPPLGSGTLPPLFGGSQPPAAESPGGAGTSDAPAASDVPADTPGPAASQGTGSVALPASTLVYERKIASDPYRAILVARDIATGEERIVTDFGDGGTPGADVGRTAISPDRRWIAFAAYFRPDPGDKSGQLGTEIVWVVDPDGRDFRRVTPPTPDLRLQGSWCSADPQCTVTLRNPAWAPDGSSLFFDLGQYTRTANGLDGGAFLAQQPLAGGLPRIFAADAGCAQVTNPVPHPAGTSLLAIHSVCTGSSRGGIHLWDAGTDRGPLVEDSLSGIQVPLERPAWTPDGKVFAFVAAADFRTGTGTVRGTGILAYEPETHNLAQVLAPPGPNARVVGFALAPDVSGLVACIMSTDTSASDLYYVKLPYDGSTLKQLTNDGVSCYPTW